MRESVRSLTAYFIVIGILGTASGIANLEQTDAGFLRLVGLFGLGVGISYFVAGLKLRRWLTSRSPLPRRVVIAGGAYGILSTMLVWFSVFVGPEKSLGIEYIIRGLLVFGVTMYLLMNLERLTKEPPTG